MVVVEDAHADPPVSRGAGEAQHFGGVIAAREMVGELGGCLLVRESADLHRPFPARFKRCGRLHHFYFYLRDARLHHIELARGGERQVNHAAGDERAAVGDADQRGVSGLDVGDAHDRSQGQGAVGGRHGVHVVDFAVRSAAVVVRRAVPAGESSLGGERSGIGGNCGFGDVGGFFRG